MTRLFAITAGLCLTAFTAATQPLLPRCSADLDGQVSQGGCRCHYDHGGQITGRSPGWRWDCDLLRGPGAIAPVPSAGDPPQPLPPGFGYAPGRGGRSNDNGNSGYDNGY